MGRRWRGSALQRDSAEAAKRRRTSFGPSLRETVLYYCGLDAAAGIRPVDGFACLSNTDYNRLNAIADYMTAVSGDGAFKGELRRRNKSVLIKISVCNRRTDKSIKTRNWNWIISSTATGILSVPRKQRRNIQSYRAKRGELKDIGGLVGGWLKDGIRKTGT